MRRGGAGVLLLALPVLALGAGPPAAAKPSTGVRSAPTIRVLDATLAPVIGRHGLRVSVRAARSGRFRVFATALPASGRGAPLLDAPVVLAGALLTGAWYAAGVRTRRLRLVGRTRRPRRLPWRGCAFALALATIVLALDSPLEREAEVTFWAHMTQHILLMMVAAPLLVLGAPWMPCWRVLPLGFRRVAAGAVVKNPRFAWLRWTARAVATSSPNRIVD